MKDIIGIIWNAMFQKVKQFLYLPKVAVVLRVSQYQVTTFTFVLTLKKVVIVGVVPFADMRSMENYLTSIMD